MRRWRVMRGLGLMYLALIILSLIGGAFLGEGSPSDGIAGCYTYDAMVVGYDCKGFTGARYPAILLNLPLAILYSPIFAVFNWRAGVAAILLWSPLVLLVISTIKLKSKNG